VIKRIGILTGGGDAPGLNAVIRAVVLTAHLEFDCEVTGIRNGFDGLLQPDGLLPLSSAVVDEILPKGGTILGAANRGNPFDRLVVRNGKQVREDVSGAVVDRIKQLALDALIVVGGDGTLGIARDLFKMGVSVIGVPKTIDNDVGGTEASFGFDTALNVAVEAIDRLHTTAESHQRVMVLEVMGRDAGFIALHSGLAGGVDVILIPELPFSHQMIAKKITARHQAGQPYGRTLSVSAPAGLFFSGTVLVEPIDTRRMDNVNLLDVRVEKTVPIDRYRIGLFLDLFNIGNSHAAEIISFSTGTAFQRPQNILAPFTARIGFRFEW